MMRKQAFTPALLLALLLVPTAARADAGTPLMWAGLLHLALLNFGIGLLEGLVLAKLFRLPKADTQAAMVAANYLSAIAGLVLLRLLWTPLERLMPGAALLYKAGWLLAGLAVLSFLLSIVLEWPFCAWAMRGTARGWRSSLWASAVAQTASYALLVPLYLLVSPISMVTSAHLDRSLQFVRNPPATVIYIDPQRGGVWRIQTDGAGKRKVLDTQITDPNARLFVRPHPNSRDYDLYEVRDLTQANGPAADQETLLMPNVGTGCARSSKVVHGAPEPDNWFSFGEPADLRPEDRRAWTVWTEFWASGGITVMHGPSPDMFKKHAVYTLAFDTPFAGWTCRNATILPSDRVVFQLGDRQIVILDMARKTLGFLVMGRGPVVVLSPRG